MKKILVVGSSNTDMVIKSTKIPKPGETVLGGEFFSFAGGKGANQAVAAAKLGGQVSFLAKLGKDSLGDDALLGYQVVGIDTSAIIRDSEAHSGVALILVDGNGENCISVASGANARLSSAEIERAESLIQTADYILAQLEIPIESVETLARFAKKWKKPLILNPAPAQGLPDSILDQLFLLTPNESEAELLTGIEVRDQEGAVAAAKVLLSRGCKQVLITLGAAGACWVSQEGVLQVSGFQVDAVDTTAAGDTFNGALVVGLAEGMSMEEAILFANRAAAISVTRMGAQISQPYRHELATYPI